MANFALIGAAGYIAPRHIKAIADTGNNLVVAYDKFDSVGCLDESFLDSSFFTKQEQFDSFIDSVKGTKDEIHWLVICTPNHTHASFIRYGLQKGMNVICEKPVVLHSQNIVEIQKLEEETGHQAYNILQLRLHDRIAALKKKVEEEPRKKIYNVNLTYITSRGKWYYTSWKGNNHKSGGLATNIGIHFFDMLQWIFGSVIDNVVNVICNDRVAGVLCMERANIKYFLSINAKCLPVNATKSEKKTYRTLNIDGEEFDFSNGFTQLHTKSYEEILAGKGFRVSEAYNAIRIVENIRNTKPIGLVGDYHPLAKLQLA